MYHTCDMTKSSSSARTVETTEYLSMIRRCLVAASRRVADADAVDLADFAIVCRATDDLLALAVAGQRRNGSSWSDIGDALGITRQAAQQRFGGRG